MKSEGPRKQIALGFRTVWVWDTHVNRAHVRTHRGVIEPDALGAEIGINLVDAVPQADGRIGHAGIQAWQLMHSSVIKIAIGSPFCLPAG